MFDTLRISSNVKIPVERLEYLKTKYKVDLVESIDKFTGELTFSAYIRGHNIPFINYYSSSETLLIEVSIPNYLYGNNVRMLTSSESIELFWTKLEKDLYELLNIQIDRYSWKAKRNDVCWNLNVSKTGLTVQEWLSFIAKQSIPYKPNKTVHYSKDKLTGVTFKANAKSQDKIMFYDKHDEVLQNKKSEGLEHEAENILRVEIRTSRYERKNFTQTQRAVDLLSILFFKNIMSKYNINQLLKHNPQKHETLPFEYLIKEQKMKISKLETLIGYMQITNDLEELAKSYYTKKTYQNRQDDIAKLQKVLNNQQETKHTLFLDFKKIE